MDTCDRVRCSPAQAAQPSAKRTRQTRRLSRAFAPWRAPQAGKLSRFYARAEPLSPFRRDQRLTGRARRRSGRGDRKGWRWRVLRAPKVGEHPALVDQRVGGLLAKRRLGRVAEPRDELIVNGDLLLGAVKLSERDALVDQRPGDRLAQRRLSRLIWTLRRAGRSIRGNAVSRGAT